MFMVIIYLTTIFKVISIFLFVGKFENKLRKFSLLSEMVSDIVLFDIVFDST